MTTTASTDWPRAYLFEIHDRAIQHGMIILEPISEADAKSLAGRLYRIRRRSDKALARFIPPDYHLVTCGAWRPGPTGEGQLPIIYNRLPDGKPLPSIRPAEGVEITAPFAPAGRLTPPPLNADVFLSNIDSAELELKPDEIEDFVNDLQRARRARKEEPEQ